jgi:hypothetical protein
VGVADENHHSPKRFFSPEAFLSHANFEMEIETAPIILLPNFSTATYLPAKVLDQRIWLCLVAAMPLVWNHHPRLATRKKSILEMPHTLKVTNIHMCSQWGSHLSHEVYCLDLNGIK